MISNNKTIEQAIKNFTKISTVGELFDKMILPNNAIIIELFFKSDVEKDADGIIVSNNKITATIPHSDTTISIPNPTIHIPRGIIIKTSPTSQYQVGDIVEFDDMYVFVDPSDTIKQELSRQSGVDSPDTALTFKLRHGYWINPAERYRVQTNYIMISEHNVTNYWRV